MKTLLLFTCLLTYHHPDTVLLVVDKQLKKPLQETNRFTLETYLQQSFQVYAAEKEAVIEAVDRAVKWMDMENECFVLDSFRTAHTTIVVSTDCVNRTRYTLMLLTRLEESQNTYSFAIADGEENKRKAQQQLLDFATYLDQ